MGRDLGPTRRTVPRTLMHIPIVIIGVSRRMLHNVRADQGSADMHSHRRVHKTASKRERKATTTILDIADHTNIAPYEQSYKATMAGTSRPAKHEP